MHGWMTIKQESQNVLNLVFPQYRMKYTYVYSVGEYFRKIAKMPQLT